MKGIFCNSILLELKAWSTAILFWLTLLSWCKIWLSVLHFGIRKYNLSFWSYSVISLLYILRLIIFKSIYLSIIEFEYCWNLEVRLQLCNILFFEKFRYLSMKNLKLAVLSSKLYFLFLFLIKGICIQTMLFYKYPHFFI